MRLEAFNFITDRETVYAFQVAVNGLNGPASDILRDSGNGRVLLREQYRTVDGAFDDEFVARFYVFGPTRSTH